MPNLTAADTASQASFPPTPPGGAASPCPKAAMQRAAVPPPSAPAALTVAPPRSPPRRPSTPAPLARSSRPCDNATARGSCRFTKLAVTQVEKADRATRDPRAKVLEVVPDSASGTRELRFTTTALSCGEPVQWTITDPNGKERTETGPSYNLEVRGWDALGSSPTVRQFDELRGASPRQYRVRAAFRCGAEAESWTVRVYPSAKLSFAIAPERLEIFGGATKNLEAWINRILGMDFDVDPPKGSFSLEGKWTEDPASWQAFFAFDVSVGLDPLIALETKASILTLLATTSGIPPSVTAWVRRYLGNALYIAVVGDSKVQGGAARIGPSKWSPWKLAGECGIAVRLGFDIKAADEEVAKAEFYGESRLSLEAALQPPETADEPLAKVDLLLHPLSVFVECEVASGWLSFERQHQLLDDCTIYSNHEIKLLQPGS